MLNWHVATTLGTDVVAHGTGHLVRSLPDNILVFQLLEEAYLPQCCTGHPLGKTETLWVLRNMFPYGR